MKIISVVYHTGTGHTRLLAEAVREGAASVSGVEARLLEVQGRDIVEGRYANDEVFEALDASDAIIFGCPTYMGNVSAQMKAFIDAGLSRWYARAWSGKLGAAFTVSSTPAGDKLSTLEALMISALQMGMIWVGVDQSPINAEGLNRLGFYVGAAAQAEYGKEQVSVDASDLATGAGLGRRVAETVLCLAPRAPG